VTAAGWLTVREVADRLGYNPRTIYDGVRAGTVPHRRVGRALRIPASWVDAVGLDVDVDRTASDLKSFAAELAAAVACELARLLGEAAARATAPGETGTVLDDLDARDDIGGRHDGTG
jgi:excisionase family DNA binding protein